MSGSTDFDLHGLFGLRLVDAGEGEVRAIERQVGPIQRVLDREPDLTIRFVDELRAARPLRLLGLDDVGFTDEHFLILKSKNKYRGRCQIPMEELGEPCEVLCERGLPRVPLLIQMINLRLLAKGVLPLHAAAFEYEGKGILTTGWSKGGKTEALLGFMAAGARFIGDEWVYIDGDRLYGIGEPIRVWTWHLEHLPEFRRRVGRSSRARLGALKAAHGAAAFLTRRGPRAVVRQAHRARSLLHRQLGLDVAPEAMFGAERCALAGNFDRLFFVASHDAPTTSARPLEASEVADRMLYSLQEEQTPLLSHYWRYRFAFPRRSNPILERSRELQAELLHARFAGKPSFEVVHPYPVPIPALVTSMQQALEGLRSSWSPSH